MSKTVNLKRGVLAYISMDRHLSSLSGTSARDRAVNFEHFVYREHAKRRLLSEVLPSIDFGALDTAFRLWCKKGEQNINNVFSDAYHLARVRIMKLEVQEDSLQRLVTYWFVHELESRSNLDNDRLRSMFELQETTPRLNKELEALRRDYIRELSEA
jgi:hypothetical protein